MANLQLPPHNPDRSTTAPTVPQDLVAKANAEGFVTLKWKRNGNPTGTVFIIESQSAPGGAWTQVGAVTTAKFEWQAEVGHFIGFRVKATRTKQSSQFSTPVVLWADGGSGEVFELKAA